MKRKKKKPSISSVTPAAPPVVDPSKEMTILKSAPSD